MRRENGAERAAWTAFIEGKSNPANKYGVAPTPDPRPLKAHGRQRVEHKNKTESAYESHLNLRKITGEIVWFQFEGLTFKLANDTRYTPDFALLLTDGTLECHEIGASKRAEKATESPDLRMMRESR